MRLSKLKRIIVYVAIVILTLCCLAAASFYPIAALLFGAQWLWGLIIIPLDIAAIVCCIFMLIE